MKTTLRFFYLILLVSLVTGCGRKDHTLFTLLPPQRTGVSFNNYIEESDTFNILFDEYIYNGGGVGVGDFNNDGLIDIYFTGNEVGNRLYFNRGDFRFEDITERAGVMAGDIWSSGITVVDINNDGWLDMYISATFKHVDGTRRNKLYINQGLKDGIPVFVDKASDYGLDDDRHTTQAAFFDFDMDGDLDLFNLTNVFLGKRVMTDQRLINMDKSQTVDVLYRNEGNGTFSDVSSEAGIVYEGFGLGIAVLDVNRDGYPDLYISNDFVSNDVLYVNNGDGTFTNQLEKYFKHISYASMGSDASDINNDGLVDIITLEMLPSDNHGMKMMYSNTVYNRDRILADAGYYRQYLRNCLQYNNGNGTFSDISFLLGISDTDWSWSALFSDFDNDGFRDLAIANGFPKNVTDKDYIKQMNEMAGLASNPNLLLPYIPEYRSENFFFKNLGGRKFEDVSKAWGINTGSFSNGAAFADLDNDGDMDYITNNIDEPAFIFENKAEVLFPQRHWLKIKLSGDERNKTGTGTRITVYTGDEKQYYEHYTSRGYISSVDPVIHFGLDSLEEVDSIRVTWPLGEEQVLYNVSADSLYEIDIRQAVKPGMKVEKIHSPVFQDITGSAGIAYTHKEFEFIDFKIQPLLPHLHSRLGPGIAVGDINGDGREDLIIGNGRKAATKMMLQNLDGTYSISELTDSVDSEDSGLLLFDADNDGDLDLYVVSGGSEFHAHSHHFRDRFFRNDGEGNLLYDPDAIPDILISGSVVTAADYDQDGDLDLFIGGRLVPQSYPFPERSILLANEEGRFVDVTESACSEFMKLGMVTSALWTDFDMDGWVDLMVTGEWMPVRLFKNQDGKFTEVSKQVGLSDTEGWWNSLASLDLDRDGDIDYILGNQGRNNRYNPEEKKPIYVIAKDFDNNGVVDPVINAWKDGNYYPVHFRNDLIRQMPYFNTRFPQFIDYSRIRSTELFTEEELEGAIELNTRIFNSMILRNNGNGKYSLEKLPFEAQFAPVKGILTSDFNFDGLPDVVMIGNNYHSESFNGAHDAFTGLYLEGKENGALSPFKANESGFIVNGDGRSLVSLFDAKGNTLLVASQNADSLRVFKVKNPGRDWVQFSPLPMDRKVKIHYNDGAVSVKELYYGSSYLSQSSRKFLIDGSGIEKIIIIDYKNNSREIPVSRLRR